MSEQDWRKLFQAALLELDRTRLPERVEAAHNAIHERVVQHKEVTPEEREEIDDALRALYTLMR